jgi:hypothetical protein
MSITLLDVENKVLNLLQKNVSYSGFYTSSKVIQAINECLDYISARMMMEGNGWMQKIGYITTVANTGEYALPTDCAIIRAVRYLIGDIYVPVYLDSQERDVYVKDNVQTQAPIRYRLISNKILFNPIPALIATNAVQLEYTAYTADLAAAIDVVDGQFEKALVWYVVYRSASILASTVGKAEADWIKYENQWYKVMENIITRRNSTPQYVREFQR